MSERALSQISSLMREESSLDATSPALLDAAFSPDVTYVAPLTIDGVYDAGLASDEWTAEWLPDDVAQVARAGGFGFSGGSGMFAGGGGFSGGASGGGGGIESRGAGDIDADRSARLDSTVSSAFESQAFGLVGANARNGRDDGDSDRRDERRSDSPRADSRDDHDRGRGGDDRGARDGQQPGGPKGAPGGNSPVAVPEPSSLLLTGLGLIGLSRAMRRRTEH